METYKYKILVLSDLSKSTSTTIKSSVSLAQMIGADIDLFHVKKHTDIVNIDNQLSAIRTLNDEQIITKKKIEALIDPISKAYNATINYNYAFGKIKEEISNYITLTKPDIIVLGQRDSNPLQLIGDSITRFILKEFKGVIMISSNENALIPNEKMSLGVFNDSHKIFNGKFSKDLITHAKAPLKSFKIINSQKETVKLADENEEKFIEYVFEQNADAMDTLSSYLLKNSINLLCIDRAEDTSKNTGETSLREVVSKLNVSLLVSEA
ncbi:universal stress protein [Winogradskyella costae]|uniref:universal stress protein n=1 Tax=Winogradskyella costae TaxID=2697008 RepID=UPI0015CC920F|nr:universal stress protein [Winogradskyella costae]